MRMKNTPRRSRTLSHLVAGLSMSVATGVLAVGIAMPTAAIARPLASASEAATFTIDVAKVGDKVTIKLKDGRTVIGEIISIDERVVKIKQKTSSLVATIEYSRTEIDSIAVTLASGPNTAPVENPSAPSSAPAPGKSAGSDAKNPYASNNSPPSFYFVPFTGEFGRRVCATPLKDVLADAKRASPDYLVFEFNCDFSFDGKAGTEDSRQIFLTWNRGMSVATEMSTLMTDAIRDDKSWVKKPKVVGWVRRALGPSALLPLALKDLYYSSDARHGGIGYLDFLFSGIDESVRQKQISLREGAVKGLGNKGGFDERIVLAMTKTTYVLSLSMVGGKPELHENRTGDETLTDSGLGGERDTIEEIARGTANDTLTLNAQMASKLGIAKGIADSNDELFFELGVARDAKVIEGKAGKIFDAWQRGVDRAERDIPELLEKADTIEIRGNTPAERNQARGQQLGHLNRVRDLVKKYAEVLRDEGEQLLGDLNKRIELLRQQISYDR